MWYNRHQPPYWTSEFRYPLGKDYVDGSQCRRFLAEDLMIAPSSQDRRTSIKASDLEYSLSKAIAAVVWYGE